MIAQGIDSGLITGIISTGGVGIAIAFVLTLLGILWVKPAVDDIKGERNRAIADRDRAEQREQDTARLMQDKIVPILQSFTSSTEALLPLLQEQIRYREAHRRDRQ